MKKYILVMVLCTALLSCQDFLDTESLTKKTTADFPVSQNDAIQMITGIYATLNDATAEIDTHHFFTAEVASDDRFGGGSSSNRNAQASDRMLVPNLNDFEYFWSARYSGIFRANTAIETMDNVQEWTTEGKREELLGEAYFLRALFYFELEQMFGEVPLVLETAPVNLPKSPAVEVYAQITSDLLHAIELLPDTRFGNFESGRATKWASEALLARVFLFYTGYYKQTSLPVKDGNQLEKSTVISHLEDCINNSGHNLISDPRELWPYCNQYTAADYPYAAQNGLNWAGDGNIETVFAVKFSNIADWSSTESIGFSNRFCLYFALRADANGMSSFPFGLGWANGTANKKLWDDWESAEPNDIRRKGSIININEEYPGYVGQTAKQREGTGFWAKKYISIQAYSEDKSTIYDTYAFYEGASNDYQTGLTQDLVLIRFADVLLMHSELTETADGINKVRARAGLENVSFSLDALKAERRWELCFEGQRWFDLMRWGDAATVIPANQVGVTIKNLTKTESYKFDSADKEFSQRYEVTGGFWPIPSTQISLSEGVLVQNKGWTDEGTCIFTVLPY